MGANLFEGSYTGQTLNNRYHISHLIGRGGMGEVYKGKHLLVGRPVAIKILRDKYSGNRTMIVRFFREAQAAAAIGHQHIIDIFDVGVTEQGDPFLVMEYLEGESLEDYLERAGKLTLGAACAILEPVLQALSAAHQKNIVHRDLKPANIFLSFGESETPVIKLIDFGVAKMPMAPESAQITQTGAMVGTPHYMAPEQIINAEKIDTRTDIFTVGVILYELLTGTLPYDAERPNAMMKEIVFGSPLPPSELHSEFPRGAEPIVMQAMERELDDRYESADAMLGDLQALDAWTERYSELAKLRPKNEKMTVAMGTLEEMDADDVDPYFASDHLLHMAGKNTPRRDGMSTDDLDELNGDSKASSTWSSSTVTISFAPLPIVAAILGVATIIILAVLFHFEIIGKEGASTKQEKSASVVAPPVSAKEDKVQINIEGLPKGAKIVFDKKLMPVNPFEIKQRFERVPISIEADGFERYESHLVPRENVVLKVDLRPIKLPQEKGSPTLDAKISSKRQAKAQSEKDLKDTRGKKRKKRRISSTKKTGDSEKNALRKGSRGLEFIESYE